MIEKLVSYDSKISNSERNRSEGDGYSKTLMKAPPPPLPHIYMRHLHRSLLLKSKWFEFTPMNLFILVTLVFLALFYVQVFLLILMKKIYKFIYMIVQFKMNTIF